MVTTFRFVNSLRIRVLTGNQSEKDKQSRPHSYCISICYETVCKFPGGQEGDEAEVKEYREGMEVHRGDDGKPPEPPEGFTIYTTESGILVLRRKRTRNLQKLGKFGRDKDSRINMGIELI